MKICRKLSIGTILAAVLFTLAVKVKGEELTLRSGDKIAGTIVGFENGMFRVQTSYGFALVRKSDVLKISFEKATKAAEESLPNPKSSASSTPSSAEVFPKVKPVDSGVVSRAAPKPPVSRPLDVPFPEHVLERVVGPEYVNNTFHFALFKPLDWRLLDEVPKETGSGIMAMADEAGDTVVVVDRQVWSGPPDIRSDQVEARLRQSYEEYRKLSETSTTLGGRPALRRSFDGVVDGVEWHGISEHLAIGNMVYGIIGVTSADQYQFQQDVIEKIIRSFRLLSSSPHSF